MSTHFIFVAGVALALGSLLPVQAQTSRQEADLQRRQMREYQRFQRHYQTELGTFREALLEKNDNLQFHYSESIDLETIYLEASRAFETLEAKKLAQLPAAKVVQDAVLKAQKELRKAGQSRQYYQAKIRNLQTARINLSKLRDSLKEDEEVKIAFEETDALRKKYLAASRTYEELMTKALAKHPGAKATQQKLDEVTAKIRRAIAQPKR